jgi:hypothetical protein
MKDEAEQEQRRKDSERKYMRDAQIQADTLIIGTAAHALRRAFGTVGIARDLIDALEKIPERMRERG